jgi:hypothetical protein
LGIEEFDDALALANDLRGHAATEPAAATAATAATAKATAAAAVSAAAAVATAAGTITEAAASEAAITAAEVVVPETVPFVPAATATVAFTPFVETHARLNSLHARHSNQPTRWGQGRNRLDARESRAHGGPLNAKMVLILAIHR